MEREGSGSVQVGEWDRLAARPTDPAVQRILHDDGVDDLINTRPVQAHDVRSELGVLATGPASAEAARTESGLLTRPAVHAAHQGTGDREEVIGDRS